MGSDYVLIMSSNFQTQIVSEIGTPVSSDFGIVPYSDVPYSDVDCSYFCFVLQVLSVSQERATTDARSNENIPQRARRYGKETFQVFSARG